LALPVRSGSASGRAVGAAAAPAVAEWSGVTPAASGGDALAKLKAARAAARSRPLSADAAPPPPPQLEPPPPPPQDAAAPPPSAAQSYAARKRAAAEHAASLAQARRDAAAAREAEEIAKLPELEQLHRLSLRR
jgi:hypothetical protein